MYDHIYIYIYIYISGSLSHLFHSGWGVCEGHYPFLHLHCPFATVLPICTCITIICTCLTHYLHLYYPFALELPICTCITHYLHLHYPLLALALPIISTCITHLHLNYPFALALPIYTCIIHLHLHYPFVIFCITHYPSIAGINNTHNCIINCKALQHVILGMVLSSNNKWSQHRLLRARSARDWWLQVFTHFIHA